MSIDLLGPADAPNAVTVRPADSRVFSTDDTFFQDCTGPTTKNGTKIQAGFLNGILQQVRRAIDGMGISRNNADDDMLLKAIQAAVYPALASGAAGAYANKFRNASCSIAARGTSRTVTAAAGYTYTLDGHMVSCAGANVTVNQVGHNDSATAPHGVQIVGQVGATSAKWCQPIESVDAVALAGRQVLFQCKLYNNAGGPITPTLTIKHAGAVDTGATAWNTSTIDFSAVALQTCPVAQMTTLVWSGTLPLGVANGMSVSLDFGGALNGAYNIELRDFDMRSWTGAIAYPPLPELRDYSSELLQCQRHLPSAVPGSAYFPGGFFSSSSTGGILVQFRPLSRARPTGLTISSPSHFAISGGASGAPSSLTFSDGNQAGATVNFAGLSGASAGQAAVMTVAGGFVGNPAVILYFTGAELNGSAI